MPHKPVFDSSEIHTILTLLGADLHYVGVSFHVECKVGQPRPLIDP